nr:hypothetical protein [Halomicroarcula sp. FL173]
MSSTRIEQLLDTAQAAFDRRPTDIETGLNVSDAALLQLRKACRLLAGAEALQEQDYYTLVIEASFVAMELRWSFDFSNAGRSSRQTCPVRIQACIGRRLQPVSSTSR